MRNCLVFNVQKCQLGISRRLAMVQEKSEGKTSQAPPSRTHTHDRNTVKTGTVQGQDNFVPTYLNPINNT